MNDLRNGIRPVQVLLTRDFVEGFRQMVREEIALAAVKAKQEAKHEAKMNKRGERGGSQKPL